MKSTKSQIVSIGEVVFDILPDSRKLGGAPADFLRSAVKYGAQASLISAIGADDLGREVVTELNKFDITPVLAITPYPTGRVLIFNNFGTGHTAHILENAAWDYIPYTSQAEDCVKHADALYFDTLGLRKSYSRETILDLIDAAPQNAYRFFDVNLRLNYYDKDIICQLLKRANILKLNTEELKVLKSYLKISGTTENMCLEIKDKYNLKYVILTNMTKESLIWGDEGLTTMRNTRLQQVFAYGAGNAFAGAFIAAILHKYGQKKAHEEANAAAVEICQLYKE